MKIVIRLVFVILCTQLIPAQKAYVLVVGSSLPNKDQFNAAESHVKDLLSAIKNTTTIPIQAEKIVTSQTTKEIFITEELKTIYTKCDTNDVVFLIFAGEWISTNIPTANSRFSLSTEASLSADYILNYIDLLKARNVILLLFSSPTHAFPVTLFPKNYAIVPGGGKHVLLTKIQGKTTFTDYIENCIGALEKSSEYEIGDFDGDKKISMSEWITSLQLELNKTMIKLQGWSFDPSNDFYLKEK